VAGSLVTGLIAAVLLAAAPFVRPEEAEVTGAVLCGFALGWAMLAVLSMRFTDQPQRWAELPAAFFGLSGLLLLVFGSPVHEPLQWVWPPALLVLSLWIFRSIRRHLHSRGGRWLLYPVAGVLLLAALGGCYELVAEATDEDPSAPGRLVAVGNHRMHLHCTGSGSPTVVLEPGATMTSSTLGWVAPAVAQDTRVCVYDRAGRGWSEPADGPQDARRIATDLHTLLRRADVPGPYVLAGHSFGGLYVATFTARHPDEVAGMVLVDSTAPSAKPGVASSRSEDSYDVAGRVSALASVAARTGLMRLYNLTDHGSLPAQSRDEARATSGSADYVRSVVEEYAEGSSSADEAAALDDLGDRPLVVLTATEGHDATWRRDQDRMAELSTNSAHRVVDGATHAGLIVEEEYAAATSRAVRDVVEAVRSSASLGN
jgi:pimeloyl-ACP methyl ester carboxylesterase